MKGRLVRCCAALALSALSPRSRFPAKSHTAYRSESQRSRHGAKYLLDGTIEFGDVKVL